MLRRALSTRVATHSEKGFALIELVVALSLSVVVTGALFSTLDSGLHQTTRTFTRVDATQRARTTLAEVKNELESACVSGGVTPIQAGSTSNSLTFVSAYGNAAQPTPVEHQITFSASNGTLTDSLYSVTGGTAPDWTFSSTPYATNTLLTDVSQSGSTPPFQYFAYQEVSNGSGGYYTDSDGNPYVMLVDGTNSVPDTSPAVIPPANPLSASPPSGLSSSDAGSAAEVLVTLSVGPSGGTDENTNLADAPETVSDSMVMRLTPPPNNANSGGAFIPCQ